MTTGVDVWRQLTKTAVELMRGLKLDDDRRSAREVADAALSAFPDIPDIETYRARLEEYVRDISGHD